MHSAASPRDTSITAVDGNAPPDRSTPGQQRIHSLSVPRKPAAMMIVDAQIHLWAKGRPSAHHRQTPYLKEEALADMDAAGIDRAGPPQACDGTPD